jgi:hypothetical protein
MQKLHHGMTLSPDAKPADMTDLCRDKGLIVILV